MKTSNTIEQVRKESVKVPKEVNNRIAVIVSTPYSPTKSNYGIQFWTEEMIKVGISRNTYHSISTFIEKL